MNENKVQWDDRILLLVMCNHESKCWRGSSLSLSLSQRNEREREREREREEEKEREEEGRQKEEKNRRVKMRKEQSWTVQHLDSSDFLAVVFSSSLFLFLISFFFSPFFFLSHPIFLPFLFSQTESERNEKKGRKLFHRFLSEGHFLVPSFHSSLFFFISLSLHFSLFPSFLFPLTEQQKKKIRMSRTSFSLPLSSSLQSSYSTVTTHFSFSTFPLVHLSYKSKYHASMSTIFFFAPQTLFLSIRCRWERKKQKERERERESSFWNRTTTIFYFLFPLITVHYYFFSLFLLVFQERERGEKKWKKKMYELDTKRKWITLGQCVRNRKERKSEKKSGRVRERERERTKIKKRKREAGRESKAWG